MQRYTIQDGATTYTRISKSDARKMFRAGEVFYIIAHKMRPGFPFSMGMTIDPKPYLKEHAERALSASAVYSGSGYAFDTMLANFCFYNANCHETGTYAAFYNVSERKVSA